MSSELTIPYNWKARDYQLPLWTALESGVKRALAVWHRRAGKDLFAINRIAYEAYKRPGLYWHCFPTYAQGRKVAWEGFTKDGRKFKDAFPPCLIQSTNDKDMKLELKGTNGNAGSIYQVVGTDAINRLVGANPIGVVFSEYSLSDPSAWHLIQPILRENGGWAIFIYTPRGHNHGFDLYQRAQRSPDRWFCELLTVDTTVHDGKTVVDTKLIDEDRLDGMPEELVQQEYYCSFDAPLVGSYYAKEMTLARKEDRLTDVPYHPGQQVDTYWDLGVDDSTTIWFVQQMGPRVHVIDYYEASGEGLPHYARILQQKPYVYGRHCGPWDLEIRELGTGKTRKEAAKNLGIKFLVARKLPIEDGIESVRTLLNRCWFDKTKCERGIEAMCSYQKTYNEEKKIYSSQPLHNWASHGADAFRTMGVMVKDVYKRKVKQDLQHSGMRDYMPQEFQ